MGRRNALQADLYQSTFTSELEQCEHQLLDAIQRREETTPNSVQYIRAQDNVELINEHLCCVGRFSDPYSNCSLLAQLGLSWWKDVGPRLDCEDRLHLSDISWLLDEVRGRRLTCQESLSEEQACAYETADGPGAACADILPRAFSLQDVQYFVSKKLAFLCFLADAVATGEPIVCSL